MVLYPAIKTNLGPKLLLSAISLVVVAVPSTFGQPSPKQEPSPTQQNQESALQKEAEQQAQAANIVLEFEVVSIKPAKPGSEMEKGSGNYRDFSHTYIPAVTVHSLLKTALGFFQDDTQIIGEPNWTRSEQYSLETTIDSNVVAYLRSLHGDESGLLRVGLAGSVMFLRMLEDRCHLNYHRETKEGTGYWLVVSKPGKLRKDEEECDPESGKKLSTGCAMLQAAHKHNRYNPPVPSTMAQLAASLSFIAQHKVVDKTGLTGKYDITFDYSPEQDQSGAPPNEMRNGAAPTLPDPNAPPSLSVAIQEQLGLRLVPQKGPVEVIVIDHIERPSEN